MLKSHPTPNHSDVSLSSLEGHGFCSSEKSRGVLGFCHLPSVWPPSRVSAGCSFLPALSAVPTAGWLQVLVPPELGFGLVWFSLVFSGSLFGGRGSQPADLGHGVKSSEEGWCAELRGRGLCAVLAGALSGLGPYAP